MHFFYFYSDSFHPQRRSICTSCLFVTSNQSNITTNRWQSAILCQYESLLYNIVSLLLCVIYFVYTSLVPEIFRWCDLCNLSFDSFLTLQWSYHKQPNLKPTKKTKCWNYLQFYPNKGQVYLFSSVPSLVKIESEDLIK